MICHLDFVIWILVVEVIPTIIAKDFRELKKKIKLVEPYTDWVQLDIMDGKFVPNETWREPKDLKRIKTGLKMEAHLMLQNPFRVVDNWLKYGCQRIIVHWESLGYNKNRELKKIIEKIKKLGGEIGLALNPETNWQEIKDIPEFDLILLMTVNPGFGGQKFLPEVIPKLGALRKAFANVKIEVDGGININTGKLAVKAGANILAVGSAIFESRNIEKTIQELANLR
ncbi:MAG: ribulose-phosphate 3-epimerase [Parcubacteria group bacterium CG11_big_fil_rev_8_21_14_0_20_39_14]|nr:MAG: ribulose-phosphate 3-epimerase [Parcubacteria group bacterium CG11_big_fil_rev_8_21_14_0_20_39_14]